MKATLLYQQFLKILEYSCNGIRICDKYSIADLKDVIYKYLQI